MTCVGVYIFNSKAKKGLTMVVLLGESLFLPKAEKLTFY